MEFWFGSVVLGLCYGFLALGVYITMRIYNFPDITADGSLVLGASVTAALMSVGFNPYLGIFVGTIAGFFAGVVTGVVHTRFKVNGLLAGILVTTALYSVNLRIMGRSNIPLLNYPNLLTTFENAFFDFPKWGISLIYFGVMILIFWGILSYLFKTDFGLAMRATGDNEMMIAAQGVNTNSLKIIGIGISNALIALCGGIVAQYQGFADIGMGTGIIVYGLASVILGETVFLFGKQLSITVQLFAVILGAILFRLLVALALNVGVNPTDLKLITAAFVLIAVALPQLKKNQK